MAADDIVITGIGVVSPIGIGREAFWSSLQAGRSGVRRITLFDPSEMPVPFAGEIPDFDAKEFVVPRKSLKLMSRDIQLSYVAARLATADARLVEGAYEPERLGVVFGADMMYCELPELIGVYQKCIVDGVYQRQRWGEMSMRELFPLWMLKYLPNMPACHIAIAHDARGPCNSITLSEVSSLLAIAEGMRVIERGAADAMIVGGGSCPIHPTSMVYKQEVLLTRRRENPAAASRPFDAQRDGMVRGEGAGALVIERRAHAERRGAPILAHLRGYSSTFEPTTPGRLNSGEAIVRALTGALRSADWQADDIGHVNAHGASTVEHDRQEAQAIRAVFGDTPVTALKSFTGNLGAGCGAVELVASVMSIERGEVPFTLNYEHPDPACPVNVVRGAPLTSARPTAVALNVTTLGQSAAVVLGPA